MNFFTRENLLFESRSQTNNLILNELRSLRYEIQILKTKSARHENKITSLRKEIDYLSKIVLSFMRTYNCIMIRLIGLANWKISSGFRLLYRAFANLKTYVCKAIKSIPIKLNELLVKARNFVQSRIKTDSWCKSILLLTDNIIVLGEDSGEIALWSTQAKQKLVGNQQEHNTPIFALEKINEESFISGEYVKPICSGKSVLWKYESTNNSLVAIKSINLQCQGVWCFLIHENTPLTALCGMINGRILLWNIAENVAIESIHKHAGSVRCFTKLKGRITISGSKDNTIKSYDMDDKTGVEFSYDKEHNYGILDLKDVSFSEKLMIFASCANDKAIKIWEINKSSSLKTLFLHEDSVSNLFFARDKNMLISSSNDKKICLYDLEDNYVIRYLSNHEPISKFTCDGKSLEICTICTISNTIFIFS